MDDNRYKTARKDEILAALNSIWGHSDNLQYSEHLGTEVEHLETEIKAVLEYIIESIKEDQEITVDRTKTFQKRIEEFPEDHKNRSANNE